MESYKPSSSVLNAIPLASELTTMGSPQLKMMMTTYAPGKRGARHNHQGRPEVVYVLEGAIVDHRAEGSVEYRAGQSYVLNNGAEHTMENRGTTPAVLLVAMVSDPA
jgi:quercetin dioxygenase-like cupin family protein